MKFAPLIVSIVTISIPASVFGAGNNLQTKGKIGNGEKPYPQGASYGPLSPVADTATGLELLALPEGFSYISYGWTGQIMGDGEATPTDHDGMAVVAKKGNIISIVRNHEMSAGEFPVCKGPRYSSDERMSTGGTTTLHFDIAKGEFVDSFSSLAGLIRPCAGGPTPWGSWIAAEENFSVDRDGFDHGWIFDVPGFGISDAVPIKAAGRFNHEAAAVDPMTGYVYLTEDTGRAGLYKYVQPGSGSPNWKAGFKKGETLRDGGELYALAIVGEPRKNMKASIPDGTTFKVEWSLVTNPEAPNTSDRETVWLSADGAAEFARLEGAWWENGLLYFVSTNGGDLREGQIYTYDPSTETLTMLYESQDPAVVDGPDNIAVSSNGNMILCEDGSSNPKRLIGLTIEGDAFPFAENRVALNQTMLAVIDAVYPGTAENFFDFVPDGTPRSFTGNEWAGATFYGDWLFVNVQSPGVTFAITGPWHEGAL